MPFDRRLLLLGAKRNEVLTLEEVQRYGLDSFDDPDYVSLYGLRPSDWYGRGVRILGRTAVECTRDLLADAIGSDIAAALPPSGGSAPVVVDPFAGSANTLLWLRRHLRPATAVGFELDPAVYEATRLNLALVDADVELRHVEHGTGLAELLVDAGTPVVVFVAPPWGAALDPDLGLDLRRTQPPVPEIVELVERTFAGHPLLVAVQIHETVQSASVADITGSFDSSSTIVYALNPPGQNSGLILGLVGWPVG